MSEQTPESGNQEPSAAPGAADASFGPGVVPADTATAITVPDASGAMGVEEAAPSPPGAGTPAEAATPEPSGATTPETPEPSTPKSTGGAEPRPKSQQSQASPKSVSGAAPSESRRSPREGTSRGHRQKRLKLGELDLSTAKIGFIGAGKMAESTINGLIHYGKVSPGRIHVAAPSTKNLERFQALGCRVTKRNYDIFGRYDCDIVFLCFHGYVIKHCYKLGGTRPHPLTTNYIPHQRHPVYILSLVSGVSMNQIKACLLNPDSTSRYVLEMHRIMMNTAVGHGLGICAIDCEPDSKKLSAPIRQLLSSIAHLEYVPASQMDAACAIGGSGLAFAYYFINALADGAFKMGLSRQQAIRFASKTAQCAAQTMLESGKHPAELRDHVSSPSGAAIYGIHVLEKNDVASGVTAAVEAAHKRANDLANQDVN